MSTSNDSELTKLWQESGYAGTEKLHKFLKQRGITRYSRQDIDDFRKSQETAQIHHRTAAAPSKPITSSAPSRDFQMDLIEMQPYAQRGNRGMRYILAIVDIFSRKGFCAALKTKEPQSVMPALDAAFHELGTPMRIVTDKGSEWKSVVGSYLEEKDVWHDEVAPEHNHVNRASNKLGMIDSFIRTIKNSLYRHFTATNDTNWVDYLPTVVKGYNSNEHAGLPDGVTPNEVQEDVIAQTEVRDNDTERIEKVEEKSTGKKRALVVDDHVRVITQKHTFQRGFHPRYSRQVFSIVAVHGDWFTLSNDKRYQTASLLKVRAPVTAEKKEEVVEKEHRPVLAPGRAEVASSPKRAAASDAAATARFDHRTDQLLNAVGVDQSNRRGGLRERKPQEQLVHPKFGRIRW